MTNITPGLQAYQQQNYALAYPQLLAAAETGHAEAQCIIGSMYQLGQGVDQDTAVAAAWYEKSSAQGYGVASNNLAGLLLLQGDRERATTLYALSREQGFMHGPTERLKSEIA